MSLLATPLAQMRKRLPPAAEEYVTLVGGLAKSIWVYVVAAIGAPLSALVLSPFLAHHLSRTEYGIFAVFTTAMSLAVGVTQLGLGSAFFRAYNYDFTSPNERRL